MDSSAVIRKREATLYRHRCTEHLIHDELVSAKSRSRATGDTHVLLQPEAALSVGPQAPAPPNLSHCPVIWMFAQNS